MQYVVVYVNGTWRQVYNMKTTSTTRTIVYRLYCVLVASILGFGAGPTRSASLIIKDEEDLVAGSQLNIVGEPRSVRVLAGANAELSCEAFGTPVPTIQWFRNGKPIMIRPTAGAGAAAQQDQHQLQPQQQKKYSNLLHSPVMAEKIRNYGVRTFQMSTTSSKVHIECASKENVGVFTCAASNGKQTVTTNATVTMMDKGNALWHGGKSCTRKRSDGGKLSASPAQIYMWTDSRMERPGVSVQLMCRAAGEPAPKTVWYESSDIDDESTARLITPDDPRYTVLPNGDLLVKETPVDVPVSMFKCKAVNEHGQDSVTSMLLEVIDDTADEQGKQIIKERDDESTANQLAQLAKDDDDKAAASDLQLPM